MPTLAFCCKCSSHYMLLNSVQSQLFDTTDKPISFPEPAILGKECKALGQSVGGSQESWLRLNYAFHFNDQSDSSMKRIILDRALRSFPWIAGLGNEIGHKHDTIKLCSNRGFRWGWPVIDFVILHPLFGCFACVLRVIVLP